MDIEKRVNQLMLEANFLSLSCGFFKEVIQQHSLFRSIEVQAEQGRGLSHKAPYCPGKLYHYIIAYMFLNLLLL